jgi:hypothetical protein
METGDVGLEKMSGKWWMEWNSGKWSLVEFHDLSENLHRYVYNTFQPNKGKDLWEVLMLIWILQLFPFGLWFSQVFIFQYFYTNFRLFSLSILFPAQIILTLFLPWDKVICLAVEASQTYYPLITYMETWLLRTWLFSTDNTLLVKPASHHSHCTIWCPLTKNNILNFLCKVKTSRFSRLC